MPEKLTREIFIERSKIIHGNIYDYSKVEYINSHTKVILKCIIHGEFEVTPSHHMHSKTGCSKCSCNYNYTTEEFIDKCKLVHGDTYDYSKVKYINNTIKIIIICNIHGEFEQLPSEHIKSLTGCPWCSNEIIRNKPGTYEEFIKLANEKHGDTYDYSLVKKDFINFKSIIEIICKKHGIFKQRASVHFRACCGCQVCANNSHTSKLAISWLSYHSLTKNIQFMTGDSGEEYLISDTKYKADGYCKDTNTIYEFHGDFWHGNPKIYDQKKINPVTKTTFGSLYEKTVKKRKIVIDKGYNYVQIWEDEWNKAIKLVIYIQRLWLSKRNII